MAEAVETTISEESLDHRDSVLEGLLEVQQWTNLSDFTIFAGPEKEPFLVHRIILAARSEVGSVLIPGFSEDVQF
jgi:hypothetical protein